MKTENARTDRAKPIWPSDYSQAGHKKVNNTIFYNKTASFYIHIGLLKIWKMKTFCIAEQQLWEYSSFFFIDLLSVTEPTWCNHVIE